MVVICFLLTVTVFNLVVDEIKINGLVDEPQDVVFADAFIKIDALVEKLGLAFGLASHHDIYFSIMVLFEVNKSVFLLEIKNI